MATKRARRWAAGIGVVAALGFGASVVGINATKDPPPPPPPVEVVGDSVAVLVAEQIPGAENYAVGGTTACDTAAGLYDGSIPVTSATRALIHYGGHSWAQYDATTWQWCLDVSIEKFLSFGKTVIVATASNQTHISLAVCGDSDILYAPNGYYELRQRVLDANVYKTTVVPSLYPQVKLVDWQDIGVSQACTHPDLAQSTQMANRVVAKY